MKEETRIIIQMVATEFNIATERLDRKGSRHKEIATARHIIRYLLFKKVSMTLLEIAHATGSVDHTTVLNSLKKVNDWIDTDRTFKNRVHVLLQRSDYELYQLEVGYYLNVPQF